MRAPAALLSQRQGHRPELSRRRRLQRETVHAVDARESLTGVSGGGPAGRALFGGSFDPVHVAHLIVAETAADALGVAVHFLPAREQPFKRAAHQATPEQRAEMLELAVAGNSRLGVDRIELGLPTPSYTVRTLRALSERAPGGRGASGAGGAGGGNR